MSDNVVELGASHGSAKGLVIDWDYVALGGFARLYKACESALKDSKVVLTPALFASKLLGAPFAAGLAAVSGADGEALAEKVQEEYLTSLADAAETPRAEVLALAKEMAAKGLKVGVVTELSADFIQPVLAGLGLADAVVVSDTPAVVGGFGLKTWRRVPHEMKLAEQMGVALVASNFSLKAAMSSNLGTIAVPAAETSFQDFGGADMVADEFSSAIAETILCALRIEA